MARLNTTSEAHEGELLLIKEADKTLSVYYEPHPETIKASHTNYGSYKRKILSIDHEKELLIIYPINTFLSSGYEFLEQKYKNIKSITIDKPSYKFISTKDDVIEMLEDLPSGFVKDYNYGLGFLKDYRFFIHAIEEIKEINNITILKSTQTRIEKSSYILKFKDFDNIRKVLNRITNKHQINAITEKNIFAYNELIHKLNPDTFEERHQNYKKDTIYKTLNEYNLDKSEITTTDTNYLINILDNNKAKLAEQSSSLIKLKNNIDLINLKELIEKFESIIDKNKTEETWQKLINKNPLIISLAFGYPVIQIGQKVSVGGRSFTGKGEKVTDFLVKNELSNNAALVEIKKPQSSIISTNEYRGGMYTPSSELSSSITQILDQKYFFQQQVANISINSEDKVESFSINCILIIGLMPKERDRKKSFELFRNNSKSVTIITFDELLIKLKNLYVLLSS